MTIADLPTLNAILNGTAALLLLVGHRFIKKGNKKAHRACMIGAVFVSGLFLVSYLIYHWYHGSQQFQGTGWIRPVYFVILFTHTILAAVIVPMALITLRRGLKEDYERHRRIARWTFPLWLFVSVTGVVIYLLLYQFYAIPGSTESALTLLSRAG